MSILELSKCVMYNHHYIYVIRKYGHDKAKLMMTDTDSLLYHITTEDLYADMVDDNYLFDFSIHSTIIQMLNCLVSLKMKEVEYLFNNSSVFVAKCIV